jgi:hypothetical protein
METVWKYVLIIFGLFFIASGILMLFRPQAARNIISKAGSTYLINYSEITIRMIPAIALIMYSGFERFQELFKLSGWFMLVTSFFLLFVPPTLHHKFSVGCANVLKPVYMRLVSPFAVFIGSFIIFSVV